MLADFKLAVRSLKKTPGFTAIALLTLALGLGVNTSMFSVFNALLLRTPYPQDAQLVRIYRTTRQSRNWPHSPANFIDLRAQNTVFSGLAAAKDANFNMVSVGQPAERLRGMVVTEDFFPLLGVSPTLGRGFTVEEFQPGKNSVVVISHAAWLQYFGGAPSVVGRSIQIDAQPMTIIGVMPERFDYPIVWGRVDIWRPITVPRLMRDNNFLAEVARLRPGVSLADAQAEMNVIAPRLAADFPQSNAHSGLRLVPLARSDESDARITWFVFGLAGFVLLIACANLANLQFARHATRSREYAIRAALGGSRVRLIRAVVAECLLLSLSGGALGLLIALWCNDAVGRHFLIYSSAGLFVPLEGRVLGFAFLISAATGLIFGILPAWFSARADVNEALKQGGHGSGTGQSIQRLRHALVVGEVAFALVLLAGAGFFVRGIEGFLRRDPGWRVEGLVTGYLNLTGEKVSTLDKKRLFYDRLHEKLAGIPGVERAALGSAIPTWGFDYNTHFVVESHPRPEPGTEPLMAEAAVSADYFDTIGLPLVLGRNFTPDDRVDSPAVAIVNETMARALWPGQSPLHKRIGETDGPDSPQWREIVGVVRDAGTPGFIGAADTHFQEYRPLTQVPNAHAFVLRTPLPAEILEPTIRHAMAEIDPEQPVFEIRSVRRDIARRLSGPKLAADCLAGFAMLGLLLAAIGIYGVTSGFVVQRTKEIGVRLALGAQVEDILRLVLGRGLRLTLLGIALGAAAAWGVSQVLRTVAPALPPADWVTAGSVTLGLLTTALFACWLPASRAARTDPIIALRVD